MFVLDTVDAGARRRRSRRSGCGAVVADTIMTDDASRRPRSPASVPSTVGRVDGRERSTERWALRDEIGEQPDVVARLIGAVRRRSRRSPGPCRDRDDRARRDRRPRHVGSRRDLRPVPVRHPVRLPVALAAPSIVSLYHVEPVCSRSLVIGISQSGASPDVVGVVDAARRQGAPTIAITNEPGSALAAAAEHVHRPRCRARAGRRRDQDLHGRADGDRAARGGAGRRPAGARPTRGRLPRRASRPALAAEADAREAAGPTRPCAPASVLGPRLRVRDRPRVGAQAQGAGPRRRRPVLGRRLPHGPLALVEPGYPVLAVATSGAVAADLMAPAARDPRRLRRRPGRRLGPRGRARDRPALDRRRRPASPTTSRPIVSIVPAQLFAYHLTIARGLDPDAPATSARSP